MGIAGPKPIKLPTRTSGKKFKTEVTYSGCHVCVSHKTNKDGYLRKTVGGKPVMLHRYAYELHHGVKIPEGFEVDHICKNRGCFNPLHLQMLPISAHRTKDNTGRYAKRKKKAKKYWKKHDVTGAFLAEKFGVSFSAACKWIREWKS